MSRPSLNLITLYICTRTKLFVLTGCWFWVGQADRSWKCFCTHTSRWYIWLHASRVRPRSFWLILIKKKWLDLMQHLRCRYAQYGEVSPKIDVYAFGVVLYELISAMEAVVKTNETITESTGLVALVVILALYWSPLHVSAKLFQLELSCDMLVSCSLKKFFVSLIREKIFRDLLIQGLVTITQSTQSER